MPRRLDPGGFLWLAMGEPGIACALSSSIVRTEKVMSSALNVPPDAARRSRRLCVAVLDSTRATAAAPSTSIPSPPTLHGAWSRMSWSSCAWSALAPLRASARTPNISRASTILGLLKDFCITIATVGTGAAMLPRHQQCLPAVATRRVQCVLRPAGPAATLLGQVSKARTKVLVKTPVIPSGNFAQKIDPGWPDIQGRNDTL